MDRGSSDEAIVGVKSVADEDAVTYLRVKLSESGSDAGAEGRNMLLRTRISILWLLRVQPSELSLKEKRINLLITKQVRNDEIATQMESK
ncbi:MAG: hypothetical protein D3922_15685 [Candidatus Electrothrix sp. AR1]|nr:hypothetical protein [Candidatus Electrothrix sp. AR1]